MNAVTTAFCPECKEWRQCEVFKALKVWRFMKQIQRMRLKCSWCEHLFWDERE